MMLVERTARGHLILDADQEKELQRLLSVYGVKITSLGTGISEKKLYNTAIEHDIQLPSSTDIAYTVLKLHGLIHGET
ncbi:TPA: hypothetical protein I7708_08660 [Vibrio vulnificus]|nr:hypothetical protein [Vibrio vulnificus]